MNLRTRRQLALLNAQEWADFKKHWPMELLQLVNHTISGFLLGFALALALFVYGLQRFAS